jgi:hypothetical protein
MDNRILALAIEALENRKAAVDLEIQSLRSALKAGSPAYATPNPRKSKTAAARQAQSERMNAFWKQRREAKLKAKVAKAAPVIKKSSSDAANQARSEKLKAYWAKKKAAAAKK